jgi:uroporphyrinogen III methyltransferase/synthase
LVGLDPVCVPTVEIVPGTDATLDEALGRIDAFDWLIVTSANGVAPLAGRVPASARVAAVGPATAAALTAAGIGVDHVPQRFVGAEIAAGLGDLAGRRVLLAQADIASRDLRDALVERGASVVTGIAYRTLEAPPASRQPLRTALDEGVDLIAFASPSAVRGLVRLLEPAGVARARGAATACIGPVTAREATAHGFNVSVVASRHTAPDLARAVAEQLKEKIA